MYFILKTCIVLYITIAHSYELKKIEYVRNNVEYIFIKNFCIRKSGKTSMIGFVTKIFRSKQLFVESLCIHIEFLTGGMDILLGD